MFVDNVAKKAMVSEREFFLELPNILSEICNRLENIEKEIKELKSE